MPQHTQTEVLIVGAGIAGLMAGVALAERGRRAVIVDEGRVAGGRLATHVMGPGRADIGAQFFTVRSRDFRGWVSRWQGRGLVFEWSRGWSEGSLAAVPVDGHARYAVYGGLQALAIHLADRLDVRLNARLVSLVAGNDGWAAMDMRGRTYHAESVILTPPVPLALALLDVAEVPLAPDDRAALEGVAYEPCLAGVFWVHGTVRLPEPGAVQRPHAPISWIADNRRKGISPQAMLITVHASPSYSRTLWDKPDWEILIALETALYLYKSYDTEIVESHLHRWKYSRPAAAYGGGYRVAAGLPPLIFAGDAFAGPRVEGAALSGLAAANAL
ncbi:MAG: FAD-dependent oxidoreductase [Anaerolineae bacterium]|nr:FAD-dependent oxidoreductase [Anaerolineae bacterium]